MDIPSLTPSSIYPYFAIEDFATLSLQLEIHPVDLILFIEAVTTDETWGTRHPDFMEQLFRWFTGHILNRGVALGEYDRLAYAIRSHYDNLISYLPKDIKVKLKDEELMTNSMVLCLGSPYFQEKIAQECTDPSAMVLKLPQNMRSQFTPVHLYLTTGKLESLTTASENYLIEINHIARQWRVDGVIAETERQLCKYVNRERALPFLIQALQEKWIPVAQTAAAFINENDDGYTLTVLNNGQLELTVQILSEALQRVLNPVKEWVTDLTLTNVLIANTLTLGLINQLPALELLNLSHTDHAPVFLEELPEKIQKLHLIECPWITRKDLHLLSIRFPALIELRMANNHLLPASCWTEIFSFKNLKYLDLQGCYQLEDKDLLIILKGGMQLETLLLDWCTEIGDKGFLELARKGKNLIRLGLSKCALTAHAFMEIAVHCRSLIYLDVSDCPAITEKGILELVKNASDLKELSVARTEQTATFLKRLREYKPGVKIIVEGSEDEIL